MTLPVFRPLMISATFVLCSVFAGNCRAEIDLPCLMSHKLKVEKQEDHVCVSKQPLPACPALCHPSKSVKKTEAFYCIDSDKLLPDKKANAVLDVTVPVSCEATLPVFAVPDTTP
ncbi:hypothetical protein [Morganella morganii]|uniref:hypothetical protein n=1 Tax=Morganella morganii TaxID=582 RepID=UPI00090F9567|nr:hypothetical protein [Morganella morganii]SHN01625.1 hypothetical protein SAMN05216301_3594 [Morganella morganii]